MGGFQIGISNHFDITYTHSHTLAHTRTHSHTLAHTRTHTLTCTHARAHTHTHTHYKTLRSDLFTWRGRGWDHRWFAAALVRHLPQTSLCCQRAVLSSLLGSCGWNRRTWTLARCCNKHWWLLQFNVISQLPQTHWSYHSCHKHTGHITAATNTLVISQLPQTHWSYHNCHKHTGHITAAINTLVISLLP